MRRDPARSSEALFRIPGFAVTFETRRCVLSGNPIAPLPVMQQEPPAVGKPTVTLASSLFHLAGAALGCALLLAALFAAGLLVLRAVVPVP